MIQSKLTMAAVVLSIVLAATSCASPDQSVRTEDADSTESQESAVALSPAARPREGERRFKDIARETPAAQPDDLEASQPLNEKGAIACGHAEVAVVTFLNEGATTEADEAARDAALLAGQSGIAALRVEIPNLRTDIDAGTEWEKSMVEFLEACQTLGYETL